MHGLAVTQRKLGKHTEVEELYRKMLSLLEKVLGFQHLNTHLSVVDLAHFLALQQRYDKVLAMYERACSQYANLYWEDHPDTRGCRLGYP